LRIDAAYMFMKVDKILFYLFAPFIYRKVLIIAYISFISFSSYSEKNLQFLCLSDQCDSVTPLKLEEEKDSTTTNRIIYPFGKCDISIDSALILLGQIATNDHANCPIRQQSINFLDSMIHVPNFQFFTEAKLVGKLQVDQTPIAVKLEQAFQSIPQSAKSHLDSLEIITNFVYYIYPYEQPNQTLNYSDCDSIARLLNEGLLCGLCSEISHFEALIISKFFPSWGVPVELTANTDSIHQPSDQECCVSHVFVGIANYDGEIITLLDPTINAVWCDSLTGKTVSLDSARIFLWDSLRAYRIIKKQSSFFGPYHSEPMYDGSLCEFTIMFTPGFTDVPLAYNIDDSNKNFLMRGPLINFDYRDAVRGNPQQDFYWKAKGVPPSGWGWQDNLLFLRSGVCQDEVIRKKISLRYKFPVF
jgi:hypothetical protein